MDPSTLLIVAIVCIAVGYIAGILIGSMRKSESKKQPAGEGVGNPAATAGSTETPGERVDLAHFYRPAPGGPLSITVGSQSWGDVTQVPDAQRAALDGLLNEFRHWLKPMEPVEPLSEIPAGTVPATPVFIMTPPVPSAAPSYKPPFIEAKTIVAQIDEILQDMLTTGPMAKRNIRLLEMPNQGVVVRVDREQYPGIDAVPDPEIRNLIRQAVSTWEAKAV